MAQCCTNISLRSYNSFGIDAEADRFVIFDDYADLLEVLSSDGSILAGRWNILGGGCNTIFTGNYHGTLIHPNRSDNIKVETDGRQTVTVRVGAGVEWDEFVSWAVDNDLWGVENLSLIPGQVGAAPVQNIGAYGAEAKDIVRSVDMLATDTLNRMTLAKEYCAFGYRDSIFKGTLRGKAIITSVLFELAKNPSPKLGYGALKAETEKLGEATLRNIRQAVTAIRRSKLPDPKITGNAGSFFKNPVVDSRVADALKADYPMMPCYPAAEGKVKLAAGWLIEQAGWKGGKLGRVGVHEAQALVLVNLGEARGEDVTAAAERICEDVKRKFGVVIETEVNYI